MGREALEAKAIALQLADARTGFHQSQSGLPDPGIRILGVAARARRRRARGPRVRRSRHAAYDLISELYTVITSSAGEQPDAR